MYVCVCLCHRLERLILTCGLKGPCWLDIKLPSKLAPPIGIEWNSFAMLYVPCDLSLSPSHPLSLSPSSECPTNQMSWCKCEAVVDSMKCVVVAAEQAPPPPLVVMSLSMKMTLNPRTGTNEVGVALMS